MPKWLHAALPGSSLPSGQSQNSSLMYSAVICRQTSRRRILRGRGLNAYAWMLHWLRTTFALLPRHAHVSSSFVGYWSTLLGLTPRVSLLPTSPLTDPVSAQAATSRGAARTILQRTSAPSVRPGADQQTEARALPRAASAMASVGAPRRRGRQRARKRRVFPRGAHHGRSDHGMQAARSTS